MDNLLQAFLLMLTVQVSFSIGLLVGAWWASRGFDEPEWTPEQLAMLERAAGRR